MSSTPYLFRELLRSLSLGSWALAALAVGALALALQLVAVGSLLREPRSAAPREELIAVPLGTLSQRELAEVHQRLAEDPDIAGVRFRFPQDPRGEALGYYRITLHEGISPDTVIERLVGWGVFERVEEPQPEPKGLVRSWAESPQGRWLLLGGMLAIAGLALGLLAASLRAAERSFRAERKLLELSGVDPAVIRRPFVLLGGLYAALGALLAAALAAVEGAWIASNPSGLGLKRVLPELFEKGAFVRLGVRALLLGIPLVGIGAGLGQLLARGAYRYPSPRSRSRISSSSSGESGEPSDPDRDPSNAERPSSASAPKSPGP